MRLPGLTYAIKLFQSVAERNENIIERLTEQLKNKEQAIQVRPQCRWKTLILYNRYGVGLCVFNNCITLV